MRCVRWRLAAAGARSLQSRAGSRASEIYEEFGVATKPLYGFWTICPVLTGPPSSARLTRTITTTQWRGVLRASAVELCSLRDAPYYPASGRAVYAAAFTLSHPARLKVRYK